MGAVFGAEKSSGQVFQAGKATVTIDNSDCIMLGITVQVSRQLSPIPTLNRGLMWSAQYPQGTCTAQTVLSANGGKKALDNLTEGSACESKPIAIFLGADSCTLGTGTGQGVARRLTLEDAYCSQVSWSMTAQGGWIGQDFELKFTKCTVST